MAFLNTRGFLNFALHFFKGLCLRKKGAFLGVPFFEIIFYSNSFSRGKFNFLCFFEFGLLLES